MVKGHFGTLISALGTTLMLFCQYSKRRIYKMENEREREREREREKKRVGMQSLVSSS